MCENFRRAPLVRPLDSGKRQGPKKLLLRSAGPGLLPVDPFSLGSLLAIGVPFKKSQKGLKRRLGPPYLRFDLIVVHLKDRQVGLSEGPPGGPK